jgi:hypothetical protein
MILLSICRLATGILLSPLHQLRPSSAIGAQIAIRQRKKGHPGGRRGSEFRSGSHPHDLPNPLGSTGKIRIRRTWMHPSTSRLRHHESWRMNQNGAGRINPVHA